MLEAPENAADLLVGAARFSQVERLWMYGRRKNGVLRKVWHEAAGEVAPVLRTLMLKRRRVDHPGGVTLWHAPSYERRLAVVLEVAAQSGTKEYRGLVGPLAARLFEEPLDDGVDIHGLVDLVVTLATKGMAEFSVFVHPLRERAFEAVRRGCRADELREAARLLDDPPSDNDLDALRAGCAAYLEHYYSDERLDCRSDEEFEELIDNLTFFQVVLNAKTDAFVTELEEARQELQEEREQYAEAHAEEYKERWREARHEDESTADMFGSLKSDRSS